MSKLVSVIVPVYKSERYLKRCINSILRQDYKDLEIILVDDGSPDNSGQLCEEFCKQDERIVVYHKKNGGASSARNLGIEISKGEFICFIDSDDYVELDFISTLYNLIEKYNSDFAKIDYIETANDNYSEKKRSEKEFFYEGKSVEMAYLDLKVDSVCVFMYKRELIGDTRFFEGKTSEDILFNFSIFQKANNFIYMPVNKYYYFHNPNSVSNGPLDMNMLNYLDLRKKIYEHYSERGEKEFIVKSEVLYARAAMGLMARMALYGKCEEIDERKYIKSFKKVFEKHARSFFLDKNTAFSRKLLAIFVFYFYIFAKLLRGCLK